MAVLPWSRASRPVWATAELLGKPMPISSGEFADQVLNALRHMHDYTCLQRHPLCSLFSPALPDGPNSAQRLHRLLLEAIEGLTPPTNVSVRSAQWRGYFILTSRYVEGRAAEEIAEELAISERQFYREHRKALEALIGLLWDKYRAIGREPSLAEPASQTREATPATTLWREVMRVSSHPDAIDPGDLIGGAILAVAPLAERYGVAISCRIQDGLRPIFANRTVLRQVLIEILSRCIVEFRIPRLRIRALHKRRRVLVEVSACSADGGSGFAEPMEIETARCLVEMEGGEWLGASFERGQHQLRFLLPTAEPQILLAVEDNPSTIQLLRRYLANEGYRVEGAHNGAEALRAARQLKPDAITLDVMLPGQDGWEILQLLKADEATRDIPVLVCSVLDARDVALSLGASAYLRKPFSQGQLLDSLAALHGPRAGR